MRAKAIRAVMGMFLTIVELIISLDFFLRMISSEHVFGQINRLFSELSIANSNGSENYVDGRKVQGLIVALVFMLFGYVLIVFLPKEVEKREKSNRIYRGVFVD